MFPILMGGLRAIFLIMGLNIVLTKTIFNYQFFLNFQM